VERTLRARTISRGIFLEWELEEGVQLDGAAAPKRIFDEDPARMDVSCPAQRTVRDGRGR